MAIKSSISFGLVYIPVTLANVIKSSDIGFNMLHKKYNSRINYKKTCPECENEEVKQEDIVKGYEYEDGKYVVFDDEDFEKIKSKKDKTITIEKFVDIDDIDPIFYEKPYYVRPAAGAERAFNLLLQALESEGKVGIAKTVLGTKDSLVALRARQGDMILSTMHFQQEVQQNQYKNVDIPINEKELGLAKSIVDNMTGEFDISQYKDEYREKVQQAIEQKISGKEIVTQEKEKRINVINLMDALQQSLKMTDKAEKIASVKTKKGKQKQA